MTAPVTTPPVCAEATLSCWFGRINVESEVPGLDDVIAAVLAPYFTLTPGHTLGAVTVRITRSARLPVSSSDLEAVRRTPQLWLNEDGPRFVLLDHGHDRMVLLRDAEEDSGPMLVTASRPAGHVHLEVYDERPQTVRALVRYLAFLVGAQLHHGGVPVLHGSAVARHGESVIMLGATNSGKSTLAFLATTLAGWDFVSDDTLMVWRDHASAPPRVSGWPRRLGISVGSLVGHPARARFEQATLRRYDGPVGPLPTPGASSWTREGRVRVYCDLDEFTAITGATVDQESRPRGILLPQADPTVRGWRVEPVDGVPPELAPVAGRNLRHFVDYLGVLPSSVADTVTRDAVLAGLAALPCARVRYGPDVNDDFPRFWADATAALATPAGVR
ncbi:hypothetical protein GCM10017779_63650 [Streptomyces capillispiralis]|uniref:HprK-related kinase B n=1 Tax=Streptomyces capillispiralis TaxID=68182 RepID=A0A561TBY3_9ACTN|nr:hypothetical protein FHX78_111562 [Streptomyces capillispiralis]GHH95908.1 hypothetical protein GCM10017779_63650 [Streptomyces capillispiralis]